MVDVYGRGRSRTVVWQHKLDLGVGPGKQHTKIRLFAAWAVRLLAQRAPEEIKP